jgi:hypothetical protein
MPETNSRRRAALCWLGSLLAVLLMSSLAVSRAEPQLEGHNDFLALYAAPHLIASGNLYDGPALLQKEAELTGLYSQNLGFIRPPFVAALLWPLSQLPYRSALRVWQAASLLTIITFALSWTPPARQYTALFVSMSIPALLAWLNGQDTPFILLAVAATVRLHLAGKPALAGLVFALCAAKGHLFLLAPIWILARRDWGFLRGLLAGGLALAALSTLVAGWSWPLDMWRAVQNPAFSPNPQLMPNLHGAFEAMPAGWAIELALSLTVIAGAWILARRAEFLPGFAGLLIGGILLARHSYSADLLIVLPGCLAAIALCKAAALRLTAIALLTPPIALAIQLGRPYSLAYTLALWALLVGWAYEAHQASQVATEVAPA